jgi:hypothetical protein
MNPRKQHDWFKQHLASGGGFKTAAAAGTYNAGVRAAAPGGQTTTDGVTTNTASRGLGLNLGLKPAQRVAVRTALASGDLAGATTTLASAKPKRFARLLTKGGKTAGRLQGLLGSGGS